MAQSRLEMLAGLVEQNPQNLLARYGLAMEYAGQGESEKALESFDALMESHPDYVAAYYQAGRVLAATGEAARAREVYAKGIEAAGRVGDQHARSELEAALAELE